MKRLLTGALLSCALTVFSAPIKVACVGDSITFGATIQNREHNSYPAQLGVMLGSDYEVRNFGVGGATLLKKGGKPYWNQGRFQDAQAFQPDIVVIKLGTNDSRPQNWQFKEEYAPNYIEMVELFQNLESKPTVWICYPMPAYEPRWGISNKPITEDIMPLIDMVSEKTGAKIIDLHTPMIGKDDLAPDRIHPNAQGAKILAETVFSALRSATEK